MLHFAKITSFTLFGLLLLAVTGCGQPAGTSNSLSAKSVAAHRARLTQAEEPEGVQTVADVRLALVGESEHDHEDGHEEGHEDGHHEEGHEEGLEHDHDGDGIPDHAPGDHDHASESLQVVMVGHIGGLANPWAEVQPDFPFSKTRAVFFLADPQAIVEHEESGHTHAPGEECAFCAAHAADRADMLAMVQFVDEQGKVLPVDVRQLFDVKENDMVVVSGKAHITASGILVVDAQGLYIRK